MRFTVVATGQFSLDRAFGFGLAASSLTKLSVVNSPIRPAGLSPAWHPASPAHARNPKAEMRLCIRAEKVLRGHRLERELSVFGLRPALRDFGSRISILPAVRRN